MKTMPILRLHLQFGYFALAYGNSWGGILSLPKSWGFELGALPPGDKGLVIALMLLASASGLLLTAWLDVGAGLRDLGSRAVH